MFEISTDPNIYGYDINLINYLDYKLGILHYTITIITITITIILFYIHLYNILFLRLYEELHGLLNYYLSYITKKMYL